MTNTSVSVERRGVALTILDQLGWGVKASVGAREYVALDDGISFRVGSSYVTRRAIVRLNGSDLYDVEIGKMSRRTFVWTTEYEASDVFCADLGRVLLDGLAAVAS